MKQLSNETVDRLIRMLTHAVSAETFRDALNHVRSIPLKDNKVELTACDGHMLSQVIVEDEALFSAGESYMHRDQLPFLKIIKKQWKHGAPAESIKGSLKVEGKELLNQDKIQYPNIDQIKPKFDGTFEIGLNADLLLSLAETLKGAKLPIVHLVFKDSVSPIKVFSGESEGCLMPVRITQKLSKNA